MRSAANGSEVKLREELQDSRQVGSYPVVVELPGGEPGLVAHRGTEKLAPAAQPVDRLRRLQPKPRLDLGRGQRTLDELAHQGAAALVVEAAGGDALQRSMRFRRRL